MYILLTALIIIIIQSIINNNLQKTSMISQKKKSAYFEDKERMGLHVFKKKNTPIVIPNSNLMNNPNSIHSIQNCSANTALIPFVLLQNSQKSNYNESQVSGVVSNENLFINSSNTNNDMKQKKYMESNLNLNNENVNNGNNNTINKNRQSNYNRNVTINLYSQQPTLQAYNDIVKKPFLPVTRSLSKIQKRQQDYQKINLKSQSNIVEPIIFKQNYKLTNNNFDQTDVKLFCKNHPNKEAAYFNEGNKLNNTSSCPLLFSDICIRQTFQLKRSNNKIQSQIFCPKCALQLTKIGNRLTQITSTTYLQMIIGNMVQQEIYNLQMSYKRVFLKLEQQLNLMKKVLRQNWQDVIDGLRKQNLEIRGKINQQEIKLQKQKLEKQNNIKIKQRVFDMVIFKSNSQNFDDNITKIKDLIGKFQVKQIRFSQNQNISINITNQNSTINKQKQKIPQRYNANIPVINIPNNSSLSKSPKKTPFSFSLCSSARSNKADILISNLKKSAHIKKKNNCALISNNQKDQNQKSLSSSTKLMSHRLCINNNNNINCKSKNKPIKSTNSQISNGQPAQIFIQLYGSDYKHYWSNNRNTSNGTLNNNINMQTISKGEKLAFTTKQIFSHRNMTVTEQEDEQQDKRRRKTYEPKDCQNGKKWKINSRKLHNLVGQTKKTVMSHQIENILN